MHCLHCKAEDNTEEEVKTDNYDTAGSEDEAQASAEDEESKTVEDDNTDSDVSTDEEDTGAEDSEEKQTEQPEGEGNKPEEQSGGNEEIKKRKKEAMLTNSCRGYAEGNKDSICSQYIRCSDCWADFK